MYTLNANTDWQTRFICQRNSSLVFPGDTQYTLGLSCRIRCIFQSHLFPRNQYNPIYQLNIHYIIYISQYPKNIAVELQVKMSRYKLKVLKTIYHLWIQKMSIYQGWNRYLKYRFRTGTFWKSRNQNLIGTLIFFFFLRTRNRNRFLVIENFSVFSSHGKKIENK